MYQPDDPGLIPVDLKRMSWIRLELLSELADDWLDGEDRLLSEETELEDGLETELEDGLETELEDWLETELEE
jgi:hypothetical protein